MASYTKEEFAQMMAQMEDSGQRITKITEKGSFIIKLFPIINFLSLI